MSEGTFQLRMEVLTASTSRQANWWWEAALREGAGSQLGGFWQEISAQGEDLSQISYSFLFRSIFLSEDGRKMGRWRCPARVTALLLCKGWQEVDEEKEEEQLLLAGDVQVTSKKSHGSCVASFARVPSITFV